MVWNHNTAVARHCNSAPLRMYGIMPFCCRSVAIARHRDSADAQLSGIVIFQFLGASALWCCAISLL
jgi:hypothetical protein